MRNIAFFLSLLLMIACKQTEKKEVNINEQSENRIVSASGAISEIIFALGRADDIVAVDFTSTYPNELNNLPNIGYRNQINAEGILSFNPNWLFTENAYIDEDVLQQLKSVGLKVNVLDKPQSVEASKALISTMGNLLDEEEKADSIIQSLNNELKELEAITSKISGKASVAFIMVRGPETVFLAGKNSFASNFIRLAGAEFAGLKEGNFRPLTPEALISLNPDFILLFESSLKSVGGIDGLSRITGITETKAWEKQQIIGMDGNLISGFGPRIIKAALELHQNIYTLE